MDEQPSADGHSYFPGDNRLEGILEWPEARGGSGGSPGPASTAPTGGVVIAHPHPLYGGSMVQPVVYRVAQACRQHGMATLRFNFRGVGRSEGSYSGTAEYRDVEAAALYLRGRLAGAAGGPGSGGRRGLEAGGEGAPVALAGYSFGSVMVAMAAAETQGVVGLALVAFVMDWEEMPPEAIERLSGFAGSVLAVCGERDELAPPGEVERLLSRLGLNYGLSVVQGADHFFAGKQRGVGERVAGFLEGVFARQGIPAVGRTSDLPG